jgi:aminoacrylate hydrolase
MRHTPSGLAFTVEGPVDAPAVVLSAGLGGAWAYWRPQFPVLEGRFRLVKFDHRGTGANRAELPTPYAIADMAEDVEQVLDAADVKHAHILGHALGGLVALELARRAPSRLLSMVLVNAWAKATRHSGHCFDVRLGILSAEGPAAYVKAQPLFLHSAAYIDAHFDKVQAEIEHGTTHFQGADNLRARINALRRFDATADLSAMSTPALVVAAQDDLLVPWTASAELAAALPKSCLELLPHGAHACNVEQPARFNALLDEWLSQT